MKKDLKQEKKLLLDFLKSSGTIKSKEVLKAFEKVKRENFVPDKNKGESYADHPLPIGKGATISQPTTIATMLELLELEKGQKVLEVGSGCGYVLSLISEIVGNKGEVFGIEINSDLVKSSKKILKDKKNVEIIEGDGSKGLEKEAPHDRILVSAGAQDLPKKLIEQLSSKKGVMIVPVGPIYTGQKMLKIVKEKDTIDIQEKGYYAFVPLVHK